MQTNDATSRHAMMAGSGRFLGHVAAIVAGLVLMFAGLAMGVTMVMLPVGIPLGLAGLLLLLWGASTRAKARR
jgi:hypothetical protein